MDELARDGQRADHTTRMERRPTRQVPRRGVGAPRQEHVDDRHIANAAGDEQRCVPSVYTQALRGGRVGRLGLMPYICGVGWRRVVLGGAFTVGSVALGRPEREGFADDFDGLRGPAF